MIKKTIQNLGLSALVALGSPNCTYNEHHYEDGEDGNNPSGRLGDFGNNCESPLQGKYGWEMNKCGAGFYFNDDCEMLIFLWQEGKFVRTVPLPEGDWEVDYHGLDLFGSNGINAKFDPELRLQPDHSGYDDWSEESRQKTVARRKKINGYLDRFSPNTAVLINDSCYDETCTEGDAFFVFLDREYKGKDDCKSTQYYVGDRF